MIPSNPHAIVEIGGVRYDSWRDKQLFNEVVVELSTDQASEATFRCFDPRFDVIDRFTDESGVPELVMRFWLGFGSELGEPVFKGLLERVERGDTDTTLRAYDMGYKMRRESKTEYHNNQHDLDILRKLASRNGLAFAGPDRPVRLERHESMIQDGKNDWQHSAERARAAGLVLYVRQDTLFAKEPAQVGAPLVTLAYRKDFQILRNFDLSYKLPEDIKGRPREVEWRGRRRGGRRLTGLSERHERGTRPVVVTRDPAIHNPGYVRRRAHAKKELQRDPAFQHTVRAIPGLPAVRPDVRDTIALAGVGVLMSGAYLLDRVRHVFGPGELFTEYTLYRDIA